MALALALGLPDLAAATEDRPALPSTPAEREVYATSVCSMLAERAAENGLPPAFLARLIWKESLFDPSAVSHKGAQGIAQFMPETARRRGLEDPFDADQALAASAAYLAELRTMFGNLGLAAAAYNAGEERVRRWLDGIGSLPFETRDYVASITGRSHDEWTAEGADFPIPAIGKSGEFSEQCQSLVMRQLSPQQTTGGRAGWKPWGVVLAGGFSEQRALLAFRTIRHRFPSLLKDEEPLVLYKRNLSMGRRKMVRVMVGRNSRAAAQDLCAKLTAAGAACFVEKN